MYFSQDISYGFLVSRSQFYGDNSALFSQKKKCDFGCSTIKEMTVRSF